jgi:hypothetical protein
MAAAKADSFRWPKVQKGGANGETVRLACFCFKRAHATAKCAWSVGVPKDGKFSEDWYTRTAKSKHTIRHQEIGAVGV